MQNGRARPEEIIASVKKGLYAVNFGRRPGRITSGKFVFSGPRLPHRGRQGRARGQGATLIGNGPDVLTKVDMIGQRHDARSGIGTCGKTPGCPGSASASRTLRIAGLTVGAPAAA